MAMPNYDNYQAEWNTSIQVTNKFDGYLIDLRKYGFTLITGLITAGSFLGANASTQIAQVGVVIVTMILIVALYWLDTYYQNLLYGSVLRSIFLEIFRLNRGLSLYVSGLYGNKPHLVNILRFLYLGFLIGVFVLGLFVVGIIGQESVNQKATAPQKIPVSINLSNPTSPKMNLRTNISSLTPQNPPVRILPNVTSNQIIFFANLITKPVLFVPLTIGFIISLIFFILIFALVDKRRQVRFSDVIARFFRTWQDIRQLPLDDQRRGMGVDTLEQEILEYQQTI